jgi:hypothetical protein
MVYLDGRFLTNVMRGAQFYNATALAANTAHTIATHTVDTIGNMNATFLMIFD